MQAIKLTMMIIVNFLTVSKQAIVRIALGYAIFVLAINAFANPVLGNIASGNVNVQQTTGSTIVNQTSQRAIINWQSFNIGAQEQTHFQQPVGGVALNRIDPTQGPSQIYGRLTATGEIILTNPAGVFFGPGSYVNVGGLIATTGNITDQNFLSGNYHFTSDPNYSGSIINQGTIIAAQNGLVALVGGNVSNTGMIQANLGKVVLASGSAFTLNFDGSNLINFTIDEKSVGGVSNKGLIQANGGTVMIAANSARSVLDNVINLDGIIEAKSVRQENGELILGDVKIDGKDNGVVRIAGKVDVSGTGTGETGGVINITGNKVLIDSGAVITANGDIGGGNINIGGNYQGKGPLTNSTATVLAQNAQLSADALTKGNGGNIILWSDSLTKAYGTISAHGGAEGGNGGFVETSSKGYLDVYGAHVDLRAAKGKTGNWLLDPADLTICTACITDANFAANIFTPNGTNSSILVSDLVTQLNTANITIQTTAAGVGGNGDIFVNTPINWASANSLLLSAFRNVNINASITNTGGASLTVTADNTVSGTGSVNLGADVNLTSGNFTANKLILTNNANVTTTSGDINFLGTVNGNFGLNANAGTGQINFNGALGAITAVNSLVATSSNAININGGIIRTVGNQTYNGAVVLGADTIFSNTGTGTAALNFINGIGGNRNVNLVGSATNSTNFSIAGPLAVDNVIITGGASGGNSLALDSAGFQDWTISGANSGQLVALAGVLTSFTFNNIQSLIGGSITDRFTLGTVFAGSINGGGGTNFLNGNNANNTWILTGPDSGTMTSLTGGFSNIQNLTGGALNDIFSIGNGLLTIGGINGGGGVNTLIGSNGPNVFTLAAGSGSGTLGSLGDGFGNIQNLVGGPSNNTFIFTDASSLAGTLNGGSSTSINTLDYSGYASPINVTLTGNLFSGTAINGGSTITSYTNINNLIVNNAFTNSLTLPNKPNVLTVTDSRIGFINDPLFFNGFNTFFALGANNLVIFNTPFTLNGSTATVNGVTMFFNGFDFSTNTVTVVDTFIPLNISSIIQQPDANAENNGPTLAVDTTTNLDATIHDITTFYDSQLMRVKINPYCSSTTTN